MKFKHKNITLFSLLAVCLLALGVIDSFSLKTDASVLTKKQKTYDIAIAFDNSGSMYADQSWCRAKYAMEIFASMLNYENGDKLTIYPMWDVVTDGTTPESSGRAEESIQPVTIMSKSDIDKISNLYTVSASDTPFSPVTKAYEHLKSSSSSEKWLIVLTDGAFNEPENDKNILRNRLLSIANDKDANIKVQYLGFAGTSKLESDEKTGLYTKQSVNAESLMNDLVDICNSIFQRSILPAEYYDGKLLNIDLSMRRVIVFVQGKGASVEYLKKNADNGITTVDALQKSGQRKFSQISVGAYYLNTTPPVDDTLYGEVVTFGKCSKGVYELSCPGAQKVQIFYEPDVDIKVSLNDADGNSVDVTEDGIESGEYTVNSTIVDGVTGEDVTNHKLMGNDVTFMTKVKKSTEPSEREYQNGEKIVFEPDDETEVVVEATYLKGEYTLSTRDDPKAFPLPLLVKNPSSAFDVKLYDIAEQYKLISISDWLPVKAVLSVDSRPLTDDEMSRTSISVKTNDAVGFFFERFTEKSEYLIHIGKDPEGAFQIPRVGTYNIEMTFTYVDEYGNTLKAVREADFSIVCDFSLTIEAEQTWYKLRNHEKWKPIKVKILIDGEPLNEEYINMIAPSFSFDEDIVYRYEVSESDSSYYVYLAQDKDGEYSKPNTGKYNMKATATLKFDENNSFEGQDSATFEIQRYSKIWRILIWIILFLILFALWLMYMLQKVLPKSIIKDTANFSTISSGELDSSFVDVEYRRKGKSLTISGSSAVDFNEQCSASFDLRAVDNRFTKSNRRRVAVMGINSVCDEIKIAGTKYVNYDGRWMKATDVGKAERGQPVSPIDQEISCSPRFELSRSDGLSNLTCKTKTMK